MATMKTTKKRNPKDATLNLHRAHGKRLDKLEAAVKEMAANIKALRHAACC